MKRYQFFFIFLILLSVFYFENAFTENLEIKSKNIILDKNKATSIFKDEVDGVKSILENSGLLAPFITNANAKVKDRISIRDDRTFAVSNHNYLLLNNSNLI